MIRVSEFLVKHKELDEEIKLEKARSRNINKIFIAIDAVVTIVFLSTYGLAFYIYYFSGDSHSTKSAIAEHTLSPITDFVTSLIIVCSVAYLKKWLKRTISKKVNVFLVRWHYLNLGLLTTILIVNLTLVIK